MPNQMIALESRGANIPDPTAQTAKFVNMMNMARQQEAAQRQASLAQQTMDINQAQEARAAALHDPALKKAQLEFVGLVADKFRDDVAKVRDGDTAGAEAARAEAVANVPGWANMIPPVSQWTPEVKAQLMSKASEIVAQTNPPAKSSIEYAAAGGKDDQGRPVPVGTAIQVITGLNPSTRVIPPAGAPARTPTAPPVAVGTGADMRATQGSNTTPQDLIDQGMNPNNIPSGMPTSPASFTGMGGAGAAQMTPEVMSRIADSAFQTGVIAQVDFDQLLATQPPENRQAFTDAFRRANVTVQADAPSLADSGMGQQQMAANPVQTPQARFADMRGPAPQSRTANLGGDMSMMRNTEAQYQPLQRRDPNVAPAPAEVSPNRLRAEATAKRQTPAEAAAITAAIENTKIGIQTKARLAEETRTKTIGRKLFSKALNDMRGDYNTLNKLQAIPSTGRPMLDNFGDAISSSYLGRKVQSAAGSQASVALNNIANSRLTLLNALKEVTGMSAAQLSSNVELMTFLDSLADPTQGYESAMETIRRLENLYGAPAAAQGKRRTPVVTSGWGKAEVEPN
jgi:hypothetical protein